MRGDTRKGCRGEGCTSRCSLSRDGCSHLSQIKRAIHVAVELLEHHAAHLVVVLGAHDIGLAAPELVEGELAVPARVDVGELRDDEVEVHLLRPDLDVLRLSLLEGNLDVHYGALGGVLGDGHVEHRAAVLHGEGRAGGETTRHYHLDLDRGPGGGNERGVDTCAKRARARGGPGWRGRGVENVGGLLWKMKLWS